MTVAEIVSKIRIRIKEYTDDSLFEDSYLYSEFLDKRAVALNQRLKKHHYVAPNNYSTFCMDMQEDFSHMCGCKQVGCKIYRTTNKLPNYISGRNKSTVELYTLDYTPISLVPERDSNLNSLHPLKSTKASASLVNGYVILWDKKYPSILIKMIADDPSQIMDVQSCTPQGVPPGTVPCVNVYSEDINTDREIIDFAIDKIIEGMKFSMSITTDMNNDTNPEMKV